ncbi:MAG: bacillithiol biosynthesis deacetylase BshB1 [Ferruginibacter sp.]
MKIDVLAFGVHPDDVELSCAGVLLVEKSKGKKTGIIDLTAGELGTRGSAAIRKEEATHAAKILAVDVRENLELADGFFQNDEAHQLKVIAAIRKYRPEIILCNAPEDRHPDHGRSARLVADAAFLSGLVKIETIEDSTAQQPWKPTYVLQYLQDRFLQPDFVIDVSEVFEKKLEAIKAYATQFHNPGVDGPETYISTPEFLESIINRSKMLGKMIGVKHAEGFISEKMIGFKSLDVLIQKIT